MLVLTRKVDESIELKLPTGETILIKVTRVNGSQTSIGIEAPAQVEILRSELIN